MITDSGDHHICGKVQNNPNQFLYKDGLHIHGSRAVGSRGVEGAAAPPDGGQGICTSTRLNGNIIQKQHIFSLDVTTFIIM